MTDAITRRAHVEPYALPVDAILFDLDGTLADTAPDLSAALNRVRIDRGLAPVPAAGLRAYASHGARGLLGAGMAVSPGEPRYAELRDAFLENYFAALCVHSTLFADVDTLLDAIEARSLAWGIVTNKATRYTTPLLAALGLSPRAGAVVCGDTMPFAKPHPAPLTEAANRLGIAPGRCVYVGDAARDIEAGNAAGMRTLVAAWGYIGAHETPERWPADGILEAPGALLSWLPDSARA
jgi:N-acetyl-D-muramate 6-phosphate phosphatase